MTQQLKANCLKRFVCLGVIGLTLKDVKVAARVIALVSVYVMYYLTISGIGDDSMFKYPASAITASPLGIECYSMRLVRFRCGRGSSDLRVDKMTTYRFGDIPTTQLCSGFHAANLTLIGIECVAVFPPHQVVTHTHFTGGNRTLTVLAIPSNLLSAPAIIGRAVSLYALVVHEAKPMCGVLARAAIYGACIHAYNVGNSTPRYKALGNSWAVPVARWVGERIQAVENVQAELLPSAT